MVGKQGHLGGLIRHARRAAKITQAELAKQAGVGLSAVRGVEQSQGRVSTLTAMLNALRVELRGRQLSAGPIGSALAAARKRRKTSRRELARSLGVSRNTLASIETGSGLVSVLQAYAVAVGAGLYLGKPDDDRAFFTHAGNGSNHHGWETPAILAAVLSEAVGGFDLDPCSATRNRKQARVKARLLLTIADDGLSVPWRGRVFINPPYGRKLTGWVRKCLTEARRGCTVIALLPARPDTRWWHDWVAGRADIFMLRGRLKFGDGRQSAPFPSAVIVWGAAPDMIGRLSAALTGAWHVPSHTFPPNVAKTVSVAIPA